MHPLRRRRLRTITAWLACVAVLAHAWIPALAAAGSAPGTAFPGGSICSLDAVGAALAPVSAPAPADPDSPLPSGARHCAWCVFSHAPVGPAPAQRARLPQAGAEPPAVAVRPPPVRRLARLAAHSPRAPPPA